MSRIKFGLLLMVGMLLLASCERLNFLQPTSIPTQTHLPTAPLQPQSLEACAVELVKKKLGEGVEITITSTLVEEVRLDIFTDYGQSCEESAKQDCSSGQELAYCSGLQGWMVIKPSGNRCEITDEQISPWDGKIFCPTPVPSQTPMPEASPTALITAQPTTAPTLTLELQFSRARKKYSPGGSAFSLDGQALYAAEGVQTSVYEVAEFGAEDPLHLLFSKDIPATTLALSPDGEMLALGGCGALDSYSSCQEGKIILTNPNMDRVLVTFNGHGDALRHIVFSPDMKYLASESVDSNVLVWSLENLTLVANLQRTFRIPMGISFSPDSQYLAYGDINEVYIWEVASQHLVKTIEDISDGLWWEGSLDFSPNGNRLASGSCGVENFEGCYGGRINLWDTTDYRFVDTLVDQHSAISALEFSPDGQRLAVGQFGRVWVWDFGLDSSVAIFDFSDKAGYTMDLDFNPDGTALAITMETLLDVRWLPK